MSIKENSTDTVIGCTNDEELMYICAFRYAFGRRSYITEFVSSFLRSRMCYLSTETLRILARELDIPSEKYPGDECDKNAWKKLAMMINFVLAGRENK